jgi:hypothetical protein
MLEKECDAILTFLIETPTNRKENQKWWNYTLKPQFSNINKSDFETALLILFNDGHIETIGNRNPLTGHVEFLSVSMKGQLFFSTTNYQEQSKNENALKAKAELLERNQMEFQKSQIQLNVVQAEVLEKQVNFQRRLNRLTGWIAAGTIIAAVAGLIAAIYYIVQLAHHA